MPKKSTKITRTAKGYFHDLDPYTLHGTKLEATQDRSRLAKDPDAKSRSPRVSTFYTFMQDKRKNNPTKFGSVPQGPHTFPHHGIHHGIVEARQQGKLNVFDSVIPTPTQYAQHVDDEIPASHQKRVRAMLAVSSFTKRHSRFKKLRGIKKRTEIQDIGLAHVINKLIQMDPHGSYSYKGKGASKKALSGKGESSLLPLAKQIDLPSTHGFNDVVAANTRSKTLLKTLGLVGIK